MLTKLIYSVLEQDRAPVVICDLAHVIVYMNPSAVSHYGGRSLVGRSLFDCHSSASCELIERVVAWFAESREHNIIFTSRNDRENKDVYMVALRGSDGSLIGYYEKHELRSRETAPLYKFD